MIVREANRVLRLRTMCENIAVTRPHLRRQEVHLKAWGHCKCYYVNGAVYLFPINHAKKCIVMPYDVFCTAEYNNGFTRSAFKITSLHEAYNMALECGRTGAIVCLTPKNLPYCNGALAWRLSIDANNTNGTLNRFCTLQGVSFRDGEWRPSNLSPWIGCQVWSRVCSGVELLYEAK